MSLYVIATTGPYESDEIHLTITDTTHFGTFRGQHHPRISSDYTDTAQETVNRVAALFPDLDISITEDGEMFGVKAPGKGKE